MLDETNRQENQLSESSFNGRASTVNVWNSTRDFANNQPSKHLNSSLIDTSRMYTMTKK